jgi:TctA family transporter
LVQQNLDLFWIIIWSLALANVMGTSISLILSRPIARLTRVRFNLLMPFIYIMVVLAAFQSTRHWGDLIALAAFGLLGWLMKRHRMARPPLLIGFILSPLVERYLYISNLRYGVDWLARPGVIVILVVMVLFFSVHAARALRQTGEHHA